MPQHSHLNHSSRQDQANSNSLSTSLRGNVNEIIGIFGGADQLRNAVNQLQWLLYAEHT
jgi:hypothetical protein